MKQQTKRKFSLIIDSIIAFVLAFFFIFGAVTTVNNAFTTASAEEINTTGNFAMPDTSDKSSWVEFDIVSGDTFGGNYYRFPYTENGIDEVLIVNEEFTGPSGGDKADFIQWNKIFGLHIATQRISYEVVTYNDIDYVEFYIPKAMRYVPNGENMNFAEIIYNESTIITSADPVVKRIAPTEEPDVPNEQEPIEPEEPTDDEKKTGCGSFFEDVGTVVNEVIKIDAEPFATGIFTVVLSVVVIAIVIIIFKK